MASALDNSSLSSNQDTDQFLGGYKFFGRWESNRFKKKKLFVYMSCNYLVGEIVQKIGFIFYGSWVIWLLRMCRKVYIKIAKINIEIYLSNVFFISQLL